MTRQDERRRHEVRRDKKRERTRNEKRTRKRKERRRKENKRKEEKRRAEKRKKEEGKERRKRPTHTGLATSWHHFTWPPPQHQATQNPRASIFGEIFFGKYFSIFFFWPAMSKGHSVSQKKIGFEIVSSEFFSRVRPSSVRPSSVRRPSVVRPSSLRRPSVVRGRFSGDII